MKTSISDMQVQICDAPFLSQVLVSVTAEDGLTGTGECWWGTESGYPAAGRNGPPLHLRPIVSVVEHLLKPELIGRDSSRIAEIRQAAVRRAYRYGTDGIFMCALSGVDLALWDLLGKRLGVPAATLMGGVVKQEVRAYASLPPLGDRQSILREVRRAVESGFTGIKLHESDPEAAAWAGEAAGSGISIMFDVNGAYSPIQARRAAKRLGELGVTWFEEPVCPERDQAALARLRRDAAIPLAAGENEFNLERIHALLRDADIDVLMPEITKIGGLTVARQISVLAGLYNRTLSPHGFRVGPALYANIHWALTTSTSDWVEFPFLPDGYVFPAGVTPPPLNAGTLALPEGPGLGLLFD